MELRHLRYFLKVAETKNFSKAAELLFMSQPPLSRQIKQLEEEIGTALFDRSNKKVVLTEAGKYFQKEVQLLLEQLEQTLLTTKKIGNNYSGAFRIGYISSTFSKTISKLMKHLHSQFPYVNFQLFEVSTKEQIKFLEQGRLDMGILRGPLLSPQLKAVHWFRDEFSLVFNNTQFSLQKDKDIENLKSATFIFFNKEYAPFYYNCLLEICAKYKFIPNVIHESNNINTIIQLVKNGLGVSIVPSSLSNTYREEELSFMPFRRISLTTDVLLATSNQVNTIVSQAAISFLLEYKT